MNNITFSGLKNRANSKMGGSTALTNINCNSIRTSNLAYAKNYADTNMTIEGASKYVAIKPVSNRKLVFNDNGSNIAINTNTAQTHKFYVGGSTSTGNVNSRFFRRDTGTTGSIENTSAHNICAYFASTMVGYDGFYFLSDKRIKTNIQDINDDNALQMIMKIEPKTYEYIDKVEKGNQRVYGFIAQQIKEVIPEAVKLEPLVCPNIYKIGTLNKSNLITMDMDISDTINIGSNITLITSNLGKEEYKITNVNSNQFTIDKEVTDNDNLINSNIFVYGTKINDFHILDKNYIFTLNVCATQELYKSIKINENDISQLRYQYENMSNNFTLIKNKIYKQ